MTIIVFRTFFVFTNFKQTIDTSPFKSYFKNYFTPFLIDHFPSTVVPKNYLAMKITALRKRAILIVSKNRCKQLDVTGCKYNQEIIEL